MNINAPANAPDVFDEVNFTDLWFRFQWDASNYMTDQEGDALSFTVTPTAPNYEIFNNPFGRITAVNQDWYGFPDPPVGTCFNITVIAVDSYRASKTMTGKIYYHKQP